ncbi:ABC transporter ATP-binding protein [Eubacterium ventriosum]|uniref:ABC transporter ATP-binding protein n=1 Tax=Eubacterium ventriosum TaxID=39496 RepID=A0A415LBC1_9FIRM|nr:ABC transporter ATP-binding protein [Eubacterium ventriosum]RHL45808.1 ABC transporter ATP-binding protein [Eubacterium ventriosum]
MEKQKTYGFLNNFIYALNIERKSNLRLLAITLIKPIGDIVGTLLNSYAPKYVLSFIEDDLPFNTIIMYTVIICLIMMILDVISTTCYNSFEFEYRKTEGYVEKKRMDKLFHTDFKNMESPDFLDYAQRAKTALNRGKGFHGVLYQSRNFIAQGTLMILSAALIGIQNLLMMIIFIVISFGIVKISSFFTKRDKIKFSDAMAPTWRKMNYLESTTKNFDFAKDIRLFNMSNAFFNQLSGVNETYKELNRKHHNRMVLWEVSLGSVLIVQKILMYTWLVYNVVTGAYQISDFVLYVGLVSTFHASVGYVNWIYSDMRTNSLMINDYRNFVDWKEDRETADEKDGHITEINLDKFEFRFENVSFKYPGHDNYVLKNVNLTIKNGAKLAVVGVNGAGKTTFIKLMMKLYEPSEGRVLLNDVDIKEYNREEYFKLFSPVFQNVECFAMPIYQNISFAEEDKTDMNKINEVLEQSGLSEKINSYEKGIHTNLLKIFDKEGIDLSGGEKQRLAMARALYKDGKVIILDEPTAALDALAEDRMYREFENMIHGKTAVFISHRLGSTRFCDKIAMFEDGTIVEEGTHEELMAKNGKYAYMFGIQSQYYDEKQKNSDNVEDADLEINEGVEALKVEMEGGQ